jgi:hypothetical protein
MRKGVDRPTRSGSASGITVRQHKGLERRMNRGGRHASREEQNQTERNRTKRNGFIWVIYRVITCIERRRRHRRPMELRIWLLW